MTNAEKYHFSDFTHANYRRLVETAARHYAFRGYEDFDPAERFMLWRHDVDFSMHAGRNLARIEADIGVRATYFIHLHNGFYNVLESSVLEILREILGMGHYLGLHFDTHFHSIETEAQLEEPIGFERDILEKLTGAPVVACSFHCPDSRALNFKADKYCGLANTYSAYFQANVGYCSDSNGYWRHRRLEDVLAEHKEERLQILTHPEWWQASVMSPRQRIERCIEGRARNTLDNYVKIITEGGRDDVDWQ